MKLYYSKGACSLAIRIALHEVNIACEYEAVDLKTKKYARNKDYLAINPQGSVPALELDDGQILTEGAVIQQYLTDKYHATILLPSVGLMSRYRVLEWLNYDATEIHKGFSPLFNPDVPQHVKDEIFKPILSKKLDYINQHLNEHHYLVGEHFTVADAYLFVMLRWLDHVGIKLSDWANLTNYFETIRQRKAVQLALQEEELT